MADGEQERSAIAQPKRHSVEYKFEKAYGITAMIHIMLFLGLVFGLQVVQAIDKPADVSRINQGLYFKSMGAHFLTSDKWYHSFVFEIPEKLPSPMTRNITSGTGLKPNATTDPAAYMENCFLYQDQQFSPVKGGGTRFVATPESRCKKYTPIISRLVQMTRQDHEAIAEILRAIHELMPSKITPSPKRAILGIVGKLSKSLFGIATEQIKAISK